MPTPGMTSFLHRLPAFIKPDQKIIFESIGIASDLIALALNTMEIQAAHTLNNPIGGHIQFDALGRLRMLSQAWSIVDQAHNVCNLIKTAGKHIDLRSAKDFLALGETATLLRNKMDHLANNVRNFAKSKNPQPPIFGAISFLTALEEDFAPQSDESGIRQMKAYRSIILLSSSIHSPFKVEANVASDVPSIRLPCDHFYLQSFGCAVGLSKITEAAQIFHADLAVCCEKLALEHGQSLAAQHGVSIEEMMNSTLQSTTITAIKSFSGEGAEVLKGNQSTQK